MNWLLTLMFIKKNCVLQTQYLIIKLASENNNRTALEGITMLIHVNGFVPWVNINKGLLNSKKYQGTVTLQFKTALQRISSSYDIQSEKSGSCIDHDVICSLSRSLEVHFSEYLSTCNMIQVLCCAIGRHSSLFLTSFRKGVFLCFF